MMIWDEFRQESFLTTAVILIIMQKDATILIHEILMRQILIRLLIDEALRILIETAGVETVHESKKLEY
jgi:hypothetical protein